MSFSTTTSIIPFDTGRSYVVRQLEDPERTEHRFEDQMGRTEKDRRFLDQFERIFVAAGEGDLTTCKKVVSEGFRDFNAISMGRFGTRSGKTLNVSPFKIAEARKHTHVTAYFSEMMKPTVSSSATTGFFKILEQTSERIFFDKPPQFTVVMEHFMTHRHVDFPSSLFAYLKAKQAPVLGFNNLGPHVYEASPSIKGRVAGCPIYGWSPGATRKDVFYPIYILILGAIKTGGKENVYYTRYQDSGKNPFSTTREYQPQGSDSRVYVASLQTFVKGLAGLHHATHGSDRKEKKEI